MGIGLQVGARQNGGTLHTFDPARAAVLTARCKLLFPMPESSIEFGAPCDSM